MHGGFAQQKVDATVGLRWNRQRITFLSQNGCCGKTHHAPKDFKLRSKTGKYTRTRTNGLMCVYVCVYVRTEDGGSASNHDLKDILFITDQISQGYLYGLLID